MGGFLGYILGYFQGGGVGGDFGGGRPLDRRRLQNLDFKS